MGWAQACLPGALLTTVLAGDRLFAGVVLTPGAQGHGAAFPVGSQAEAELGPVRLPADTNVLPPSSGEERE